MKIRNIDGLSGQQIRDLVADGGKFVMYKYCISIVVMTFNRPTDVYFIKPGKSAFAKGVGPLLTNVVLGWWGLPWGPIYTIGNIAKIFMGGTEITDEVLAQINQGDPDYGHGNAYNIPGNNNSVNGYNIPGNNNSQSGSTSSSYNIPGPGNNNSSDNTYNIPR